MTSGCLSAAFAQSKNSKLEAYFDEIGKAAQLNGNIALVTRDGVVSKRSFGYADFEMKKSNTLQSGFNLASISKIFTSTAILQLRDKGKLATIQFRIIIYSNYNITVFKKL